MVAVMVAVPSLSVAVTRPVLLTVATLGSELAHTRVTPDTVDGVMVAESWVVLVVLMVTDGSDIEMAVGITERTVTVQVAFLPLPSAAVAVMVDVPAASALNSPLPRYLTASVLLLLHVTALLSAFSGRTVGVRVKVLPLPTVSVVWSRATDVTNWMTVTVQVALRPVPSVVAAVMVHVPIFLAVISPVELTVATLVSELVHWMVGTIASAGSMVALSWNVFPIFRVTSVLERVID